MDHTLSKIIPVIDLFAGPGGLGEGFASLGRTEGKEYFRVLLSIEKEPAAHATLLLRSFFRQFPYNKIPSEYYSFLRGELTLEELFNIYKDEADRAQNEAWREELGRGEGFNILLDERVKQIVGCHDKWVLAGGPPCQAYSIAGRSRNKGIKGYKPEKDKRHFLYREYLRIIAKHKPPIFIMENVKGILSSKINNNLIFDRIVDDLKNPLSRDPEYSDLKTAKLSYEIFSLVNKGIANLLGENILDSKDFIIKSEKYGIPQSRHRVILLGIRTDLVEGRAPDVLVEENIVPASKVLAGLPSIRSGLSRKAVTIDSKKSWRLGIRTILSQRWLKEDVKNTNREIYDLIIKKVDTLKVPRKDRGTEFISCSANTKYKPEWYLDSRILGVCNHSSSPMDPKRGRV